MTPSMRNIPPTNDPVWNDGHEQSPPPPVYRVHHHYRRQKAQYTPPTPTRHNCRVASRRRLRCEHKFATSSRQLPTDSVDNLETEYSGLTIREFRSILITLSAITSLCRHLSPTSIAQQYRKLQTGSRLPTCAFTPPTRRNSTSLSTNLSRLVDTVTN